MSKINEKYLKFLKKKLETRWSIVSGTLSG